MSNYCLHIVDTNKCDSLALKKETDSRDISDNGSDDEPLEDDYYWSEGDECWKPNPNKDGTVH